MFKRCLECKAWEEDCTCFDWIEREEMFISMDYPLVREANLEAYERQEEQKQEDLLFWVLADRPWLIYGPSDLTNLIDGVMN